MTDPIGIVADDLTGAADALAPFRARGYACELLLAPGLDSDATVTATVTYSRALPAAEAATRTASAVADVIGHGRRPFLKIDSTMRGPIAAQLEGALSAARSSFGTARGLVCPAYPEMGRTVRDGVVYVDGVPLGESVFASDPRNPARLSAMGELLPGASPFSPSTPLPDSGVVFADATEPAQLGELVGLAAADPTVVLAGSAGLATAWSLTLPPASAPEPPRIRPAHTLLVASSRHPITLQQIDHLPDDLYAVLGEDDADGVGPVTVLVAPSRFTEHDAPRVLEGLAHQAAAFVRAERVEQLILIGGDGAAAVLLALGAEAVTLQTARMPGHAEGVVRGGLADGVSVITRAGGFGGTTTLAELLRLTLDL